MSPSRPSTDSTASSLPAVDEATRLVLPSLSFNVHQVEWYGLPELGRDRRKQRKFSLRCNEEPSVLNRLRLGSKLYWNFLSQEDADDLQCLFDEQTVYVNPALLSYRGLCPQGHSRSFQCDVIAGSVSYCRNWGFNRTVWRPWTPVARRLRDLVQDATGHRPNSMICTLSWTKDNNDPVSRMRFSGDIDDGSSIFILSLGSTATVQLVPHQSVHHTQTLVLQHGSLFELTEQTRQSYAYTITKSTSATRIDLVFCTLRSRFLPDEDIVILGSSRTIYRWEDNIRHSLGMLRPLDRMPLQAEEIMKLKALLSHTGGQIPDLEGIVITPRQETSEICVLCGRDALPKDLMPYVGWVCYDCSESWGQPQYKEQEDALVKALSDAREERIATNAHSVADAERRFERVKVRLLRHLPYSSSSSCIDSLLFLNREWQGVLLHLKARLSDQDNIKGDFPPWFVALSPAGFTPFPPFTAVTTSSPLNRFLEEVAGHVAPWMLQNRDTIKAMPRRRMLLWGEPLQIINQRFLDAGHGVPGGVECRVDDVHVEYRYEDEDEPPTDVLMFWDNCPADEVGGYSWFVVNEDGVAGVGRNGRTAYAIEL